MSRARRATHGRSPADARRSTRAFTLLEALVAIGMMAMLAGALALFLDDLGMTRAAAARTAARTRSADALFGAVETALMTAVVDGGRMGPGVRGGPESLRVLSSRTDAGSGTVHALARAAFAPLSATEVRAGGGTLTVARGGAASALLAPVRALRIRYLASDGWSDSFDSMALGELPRAVEVAIWFGQPPAEAETGGDPAEAVRAAADERASLGAPDRVRTFAVPDAASADASGSPGTPGDAKDGAP